MRSLKWCLGVALVVAAVAVPGGSARPVGKASIDVKPGQYAGLTSQGQQMGFDVVDDDPDYIDSWFFGFTLTCNKTGRTVGVGMGFGGFHVPITGFDRTFSSDFLGLFDYFQWQGKFTSYTTAKGSALTRWAALQDPTHLELCSSGRVTWSASSQSSVSAPNPDAYDMYFQITKDASGKVRVQQLR
jgi:hypothetical protein